MAWNLYDEYRKVQAGGEAAALDFTAGVLHCILVTNVYVPNQNTHNFYNDLTNEVVGSNYVAGGNLMATPLWTMDGAGLITADASDPAAWAQHATGFTDARRAILVFQVGGSWATPTDDPLVAYSDAFASDRGNVAGPFSVELAAAGIFTLPR